MAVQVKDVEQSLKVHLKDVRRKLNCSSITYVALIKDTHLLEIPEVSLCCCLATCSLRELRWFQGLKRRYRSACVDSSPNSLWAWQRCRVAATSEGALPACRTPGGTCRRAMSW